MSFPSMAGASAQCRSGKERPHACLPRAYAVVGIRSNALQSDQLACNRRRRLPSTPSGEIRVREAEALERGLEITQEGERAECRAHTQPQTRVCSSRLLKNNFHVEKQSVLPRVDLHSVYIHISPYTILSICAGAGPSMNAYQRRYY